MSPQTMVGPHLEKASKTALSKMQEPEVGSLAASPLGGCGGN